MAHGKLNQTEALFAAVKSIDEPVDWSVNMPVDHPAALAARASTGCDLNYYANSNRPGDLGHAMRGVCMAIADSFPEEVLERGMASTLRGVRNCFAARKLELSRDRELTDVPVFPKISGDE
jgi:hypothetical protein